MRKRCSKGKSCGATCIDPKERCVLDLGPLISTTIKKARRLISLDREEFVKGMKEMGAGSLSAAAGARNLFPSEPPSMPSSLRNKLAALPPPPTTSSEIRKDIASIVKDASATRANPFAVAERKLKNAREQKDLKGIQDANKELAALRKANPLPKPGLTTLENQGAAGREARQKAALEEDAKNKQANLGKPTPEAKSPNLYISPATGNTRWARNDAVDSDRNLGKVLRVGDKNYNGWKDSYGTGSTKIGEGNFGTVIRNPDGTFVKRGAVSSTEAQIINRLGKIDLGPKLIAADINGIHQYMASPGVSVRDGRIAMSGVEGKPLGVRSSTYTKFNGEYAPNVYWKAMAELHRQGIAHNDAHPDNIMVDGKGKGRWVDLGLAQSSPKAALAEVLGSFTGPKGQKPVDATPPTVMNSSIRVEPGKGNWQTRRWAATGIEDLELNRKNATSLKEYREEMPVLAKILDNSSRVNDVLKTKYKMSDDDIETLYTTSIRSPISSYNQGVWGKLTDKQAQDLINQVYEGV